MPDINRDDSNSPVRRGGLVHSKGNSVIRNINTHMLDNFICGYYTHGDSRTPAHTARRDERLSSQMTGPQRKNAFGLGGTPPPHFPPDIDIRQTV